LTKKIGEIKKTDMKKEKSYCVMGTAVRTGKRFEITNPDVYISKEQAEMAKNALEKAFKMMKNKEYTYKNLRVAKRS
jgi:hypothetical protein